MLAGKSSGLFCQMLSLTKKCQSRRLSLKLSIYAVESVHLDSQFVCFSFVWMLWQHDYDFVFELIFKDCNISSDLGHVLCVSGKVL